ncbi:hypothetical protein Nepgr_007079 [Nepenthes gracilis]|uniref:Stress-associated endoplasmic reticulum protein 2-like n=1 Tax=Nepenthes gracilis TaxID=150966 RepID=A0AAD3S6G3_NEPGR|nr:hypothetical protein Nepgr_007079 [Nepenthes gracilis]
MCRICTNSKDFRAPKLLRTEKRLLPSFLVNSSFHRTTHSSHLLFGSVSGFGILPKMTTSRRLAEKKVAKFEKNITKRGSVPETSSKKGYDYPVGPILLGFFIFVVVGSSLFQIIRTATSGGVA